MMKDVVVLLGGNVLNSGILSYCKEHGYLVVVVDWSPKAHLKGDLFICIDVKDSHGVIQALEQNGIHEILGAFSSIDLAVPSVNAINRHYGLCCMDSSVLDQVYAKSKMTSIWRENGLLNRFSEVYDGYQKEIELRLKTMSLIIKPNASSSSRGITVLPVDSTHDEIMEAFSKAQGESYDHKVIVEEFVAGREFTCDMLGDVDGSVTVYAISVKYHTLNTLNNKIAVKLHYNSNCYSDEVYERIAVVGKQCYQSLGYKASFGHLEIIMKEDGSLSPIEIGARSSGFIANPLVSIASGKDYFNDYLEVLHGKRSNEGDFINGENASMYFFYDMPHGTQCLNPCTLLDFLPEGIESKYGNHQAVETKGFVYHDISNDNERIGYEILAGKRSLLTIDAVLKAEQAFIKTNTSGIL